MSFRIRIMVSILENYPESKGEPCRICLTTDKDDNVSESPCFMELFSNIVNGTDLIKELWLCIWCKSILRKTKALRTLALSSEKILHSSCKILSSSHKLPKHRSNGLSLSKIKFIDIAVEYKAKESELKFNKNTDNNALGNNIVVYDKDSLNEIVVAKENNRQLYTKDEVKLSEITIEEHDSMDNVDKDAKFQHEINSPDEISPKYHQSILRENKIFMETNPYSLNTANEFKNSSKVKATTTMPTKANKTELIEEYPPTEIFIEPFEIKDKVLPQNKRQLKLDELKFQVRYLSLEEQLNSIEIKKSKYKDMKYQCNVCGTGFMTSNCFDDHSLRHTKASGPHKCRVCNLHFKSKTVLSQHSLSHKRLFVCLICGLNISKWSNCFAHRYKCGGPVVYVKCRVCPKIFSDEHSLKVHRRIHNMKNMYSCDICNKQFKTKQKMTVHVRTHTGNKPFTCEHCSKSFSTNSNLKAHYLVHTNETKHYCVECDTHYKTAKSLKRHLSESVRHIRERNHKFKCKNCPKELSSMKMLQCHQARHSDGQHIKCSQCDKTFSNKSNLRKHLKCIHKNTGESLEIV